VSPHAHCALRQADLRGRSAVACMRSLGAVKNTFGMRRRPVNLAVVAGTREPARTAHKPQTGPGGQHATASRSDCAAMPQKPPTIV